MSGPAGLHIARGAPPGPLSRLGIAVVALVVVADQLAKAAAEAFLPFGQHIDLVPFLSLLRTHNRGIAFSLLDSLGSNLLIAVVLIVTAAVLWIWIHARDGGWLAAVGYALIVGGAVGNLIDRLRYGYVVDYLFLHVDIAHNRLAFFIFNLADVALTCGPAVLIVTLLLRHDPGRAPDTEA